MSDNETYYYVRSTKFCSFYMYVSLFYIFIRLMLLRPCSQHYFILVMNPVTFYNNNNNSNNNPVGTILPQRIVVWEYVAPAYGYKEIGMKCSVINLT